jgi:hypothetical protein
MLGDSGRLRSGLPKSCMSTLEDVPKPVVESTVASIAPTTRSELPSATRLPEFSGEVAGVGRLAHYNVPELSEAATMPEGGSHPGLVDVRPIFLVAEPTTARHACVLRAWLPSYEIRAGVAGRDSMEATGPLSIQDSSTLKIRHL